MATTTTAELAADLGVDEGDLLLDLLDEHAAVLTDDLTSFVRQLLDPCGECTAAFGLYWPGADDESRRRSGLGGPDSTVS